MSGQDTRPGLCLRGALMLLLGATSPGAAAGCQTMHFGAGTHAARIQSTLPPGETHCLRLSVAPGQSVALDVSSARGNVAFSIRDLVDGRAHYAFISARREYRLTLYPMHRSAGPDAYTLSLSIHP